MKNHMPESLGGLYFTVFAIFMSSLRETII